MTGPAANSSKEIAMAKETPPGLAFQVKQSRGIAS